MSDDGTIRVACANILDGGISRDGTATRREQTAAALRDWQPHLVLVQELYAPGEEQTRRHLRTLANAAGLEPVALGPPRGSRRLRCGILADTTVFEILDDGPPPLPDAPVWAEAIVRVRATGTMLSVTSVHAPATTAVTQLAEAERLATRIAQRGMLGVAGGDFNAYTPDDGGLSADELSGLPAHLRPARLRTGPSGQLAANYDVHQTLTSVGMADPVPALAPEQRDPPHPPGTGSHPRARIDRFYLWPGDMLTAVRRYHQKPNPGSDHQMLMISLAPATLAVITAPGPRP